MEFCFAFWLLWQAYDECIFGEWLCQQPPNRRVQVGVLPPTQLSHRTNPRVQGRECNPNKQASENTDTVFQQLIEYFSDILKIVSQVKCPRIVYLLAFQV